MQSGGCKVGNAGRETERPEQPRSIQRVASIGQGMTAAAESNEQSLMRTDIELEPGALAAAAGTKGPASAFLSGRTRWRSTMPSVATCRNAASWSLHISDRHIQDHSPPTEKKPKNRRAIASENPEIATLSTLRYMPLQPP